ncbi:MAG TPA: ATP-binding protein [Puia sp.]|nr:ATP-binding protein [Puia sp.]
MPSPRKIVIIGPESTGKSSLCEELARHYQTQWVPEFAREYLLAGSKEYTYTDLLTIAKGQIAREDEMNSRSIAESLPLVFIDTDMYVMKVWCEFVFGKCHPWIIDRIVERNYDLYLLCNTDLPWTKDELREYPDPATREKLFRMYKDILVNQDTPWVEIKGLREGRTQHGIEAISSFLLK